MNAGTTLASLSANGRVFFRLRREGEWLVADWVGMGTLRAHESGHPSDFLPAPGVDPRRAQKLRDGVVRALLAHLDGGLALHGASVAVGDNALVLVGESGHGKSTLAAHLSLTPGVAFVADDATLLNDDGVLSRVLPSDESHWLASDARSALRMPETGEGLPKERLAPRARLTKPARLVAVVELAYDETIGAPVLEPLRGGRKFDVFRASTYRFLVDSAERNLKDFAMLVSLAERTPTYLLRRPRRLDALDDHGTMLIDLLCSTDPLPRKDRVA